MKDELKSLKNCAEEKLAQTEMCEANPGNLIRTIRQLDERINSRSEWEEDVPIFNGGL